MLAVPNEGWTRFNCSNFMYRDAKLLELYVLVLVCICLSVCVYERLLMYVLQLACLNLSLCVYFFIILLYLSIFLFFYLSAHLVSVFKPVILSLWQAKSISVCLAKYNNN